MFNVVGKHLVQEEGGEWKAEEKMGGWALPQKVEHPQLKFLVAPLLRVSIPSLDKSKGGALVASLF